MSDGVTNTKRRIVVGGNWSYEDRLDGVTLKDGERVTLGWPDGSVSTHAVIAVRTMHRIADMGSDTQIPIVQALVDVEHRGATVRVRIKDIDVEVVRSAE